MTTPSFHADNILEKAASYYGIFQDFPSKTPTRAVPDGPLFGNGDIGVVVGCDERTLRFYISKNDLWYAAAEQLGGGVKALGFLEIRPDTPLNLTFYAEQRIEHAEVIVDLRFQNDGYQNQHLQIRTYAPYQQNIIVSELECLEGNPRICADLVPMSDPKAEFLHRMSGNRISISKSYAASDVDWETHTYAVCRILGKDRTDFWLEKGERISIITCVATNHDTPQYVNLVEDTLETDFETILPDFWREHVNWWDNFWKTSGISLPSLPEVERFWYGSHYILACCSKSGKFAPGIFGNWVTTETPNWSGDYHLNYNYQAPWWGAFSSNKICLTESYDQPLLEYIPVAKKNASEQLGCKGLYAKVGIGPKGLETSMGIHSDGSICHNSAYWGQKSNAAYAALNMAMRFYHTYDNKYARECAYPFLSEAAAFWEDYLQFENGRYVIYNDCIHENPAAGLGIYNWVGENPPDYSDDFNPILTLGLLKILFKALLDISEYLDIQDERQEKWTHILEHLSEFPTQDRKGTKVFRYTEKGMDWSDGNSLGIQHIFPCGAIGLSSGSDLLKISQDTLEMMNRWQDYNAFPTFYTAAARIGYDPEIILKNMLSEFQSHAFPNLFIYYGGGGLECCSTVPSCINEMLFQSHERLLRFFPVWNRKRDAQFYHLRGYGAFLVSAKLENEKIYPIELFSEKGRPCKVLSPWENGLTVTCQGKEITCEAETTEEGIIYSFETQPNTLYELHAK